MGKSNQTKPRTSRTRSPYLLHIQSCRAQLEQKPRKQELKPSEHGNLPFDLHSSGSSDLSNLLLPEPRTRNPQETSVKGRESRRLSQEQVFARLPSSSLQKYERKETPLITTYEFRASIRTFKEGRPSGSAGGCGGGGLDGAGEVFACYLPIPTQMSNSLHFHTRSFIVTQPHTKRKRKLKNKEPEEKSSCNAWRVMAHKNQKGFLPMSLLVFPQATHVHTFMNADSTSINQQIPLCRGMRISQITSPQLIR